MENFESLLFCKEPVSPLEFAGYAILHGYFINYFNDCSFFYIAQKQAN